MTNYVKTTNFLRKDSLPDASTEKIIRGSEFDTEFNNLVIAVASKANLISPILTGIPTAPTASAGSATTQLATTAFVAQNAILTGMIVMWSGSFATIPTGYALCDGTSGTPNLANRFIMGASSSNVPSSSGGYKDAAVISHAHSASTTVNTRSGLNGTLTLLNRGGSSGSSSLMANSSGSISRNNSTGSYGAGWKGEGGSNSSTATYNMNHNHSATTSVSSAGTSGVDRNLPPYYALAFIMKT